MKKRFSVLAIALAGLLGPSAEAAVTVAFSTSSDTLVQPTEPLRVNPGAIGQELFVWIENNSGGTIDGLSLDIRTDDPTFLEATSFATENPSGRWFGDPNEGILNTEDAIVDNTNAIVFGSFGGIGILDGQQVLHGTLTYDVTGNIGETADLSLAEGSFEITVDGGSAMDVTYGTAQITAIPEPGSFAFLGLVGIAAVTRRRRR